MNFLAHAFLAGNDPDLLLGQIAADFVRGRLNDGDHGALLDGMRMHRALDSFTDSHPRVVASRGLMVGPRRRFAGIIVDVLYDHFLARHWARYSDEPLADFSLRSYALLESRVAELPAPLQRFAPYMIERDLLGSIGEEASLVASFERLDRRFSRPTPLREALHELHVHGAQLESDFLDFFPQACDFAKQMIEKRQGTPIRPA